MFPVASASRVAVPLRQVMVIARSDEQADQAPWVSRLRLAHPSGCEGIGGPIRVGSYFDPMTITTQGRSFLEGVLQELSHQNGQEAKSAAVAVAAAALPAALPAAAALMPATPSLSATAGRRISVEDLFAAADQAGGFMGLSEPAPDVAVAADAFTAIPPPTLLPSANPATSPAGRRISVDDLFAAANKAGGFLGTSGSPPGSVDVAEKVGGFMGLSGPPPVVAVGSYSAGPGAGKSYLFQSLHKILCTLAYQIAGHDPSYLKHAQRVCENPEDIRTLPGSWSRLFREYFNAEGSRSSVYIVVDGLDEAHQHDREEFLRLLRAADQGPEGDRISALQTLLVGRLDLSQDVERIMERLIPMIEVSARENSADIDNYIAVSLEKSATIRKLPGALRQEISTKLREWADGMFLWVKLMIAELSAQYRHDQIRQALHQMPKGLSSMISRVLERHSLDLAPGAIEDLNKLLSWVACVARPLTLAELDLAKLDVGITARPIDGQEIKDWAQILVLGELKSNELEDHRSYAIGQAHRFNSGGGDIRHSEVRLGYHRAPFLFRARPLLAINDTSTAQSLLHRPGSGQTAELKRDAAPTAPKAALAVEVGNLPPATADATSPSDTNQNRPLTIADRGQARVEKRTARRNVARERLAPAEDWDGLLGSPSGDSTEPVVDDITPSFDEAIVVPDVVQTRPEREDQIPLSARQLCRYPSPDEVRSWPRHSEMVERPGRRTSDV
ncbi:MAG: hypothetical protein M1826_001124 [Phylliscum demangeonii]|nr:MAG: hypothetical protein M1826_001124 [Phylliscum demangeonii]